MQMRKNLLAVSMMALGGLLGYAAAAGQFTLLWQAHAGPPDNPAGTSPASGPGYCSDSLDKGLLLARADGRDS